MTIESEVQKLEPGDRWIGYEVDLTMFGAGFLRFHPYAQLGTMFWKGVEYAPYPIKADGFTATTDKPPSPRLTAANINRQITMLCAAYDDMVGAKLTRRRTLAKFLDAVNFQYNKLAYSQTLSNAAWTKLGGVTVADNYNAVTGDSRLTDSSTTEFAYVRQIIPIPADTLDYTVTFKVRKGPAGQQRSGVDLQLLGGTTVGVYARFDGYGGTNNGISMVDFDANYWLVTLPIANNGTNTSLYFDLFPARGPANSNAPGVVTSTGSVIVRELQLTKGAAQTYQNSDPAVLHPTADPNEEFSDDVWFIDRKSVETVESVEFELASAMDFNGVRLPRRQIIANQCPWLYRGPECNYTGPAVAMADGTPTSNPLLDRCGKRISDCKLRFGATGILNYGGFPASGLSS